MKKKLILLSLLVTLFLSSCTVHVWKYEWKGDKQTAYSIVYTYRRGPAEPVIHIFDPSNSPRRR